MKLVTKHLNDQERDQFAATGLIVIDGERGYEFFGMAPEWPNVGWRSTVPLNLAGEAICHNDGRVEVRTGPPVAPEGWRILAEPCDTCEGDGYDPSPTPAEDYSDGPCPRSIGPNPDCDGGRRVVTLTATCPRCHGTGYGSTGDYGCVFCDEGVVTLGRFTIELLPVGDPFAPLPAGAPWFCASGVDYGYIIDADGGARGARIMLAVDPGQFIVRPERVQ